MAYQKECLKQWEAPETTKGRLLAKSLANHTHFCASIIAYPAQPIQDFFGLVFFGFPSNLVDSFIRGFSENGIIIVNDLLLMFIHDQRIAMEHTQLGYIMNSLNFRVGHKNRLLAAVGNNISSARQR